MSSSRSPPAKEVTSGSGGIHRNVFSGRSVGILLISVVVGQLAMLSALYVQNMQLSSSLGEFKARAETFKELMEKNGECKCPSCPPADEAVRASLVALHEKFEKTSEKLNNGVDSVNKKVAAYGKKFESLINKVQKFMPMASMAGLGF